MNSLAGMRKRFGNELSGWKETEVRGSGSLSSPGYFFTYDGSHSPQCSWFTKVPQICTYLLTKYLFISVIPSRNHGIHPFFGAAQCHRTSPKPRPCSGLISNTVTFLGVRVCQKDTPPPPCGGSSSRLIFSGNLTGFKVLWEFWAFL